MNNSKLTEKDFKGEAVLPSRPLNCSAARGIEETSFCVLCENDQTAIGVCSCEHCLINHPKGALICENCTLYSLDVAYFE